jgi:hypothetical protein
MEKTVVELEDYGTHGMAYHMDFNYECPLCANKSMATYFCDEDEAEVTVSDEDGYRWQTYRKWSDFTITCDECEGEFIAEGGDTFVEFEYKPKVYRKSY